MMPMRKPKKGVRMAPGGVPPPPLIPPDYPRFPPPGPLGGPLVFGRYGPPYPEPTFQPGPSGFSPNTWRPEPQYYPLPPSPPRFPNPSGPPQGSWDHPIPIPLEPLDPPPPPPPPPVWAGADRREPPSPYFENGWSKNGRETMAERMFEPSDNWKQTHSSSLDRAANDRPQDSPSEPVARSMRGRNWQRNMRNHYSPPHNHYSPPRDHWSPSSPRDIYSSPGNHYSPPSHASDSYRPYSPSPSPARYPYMNPRSDSYRPGFDEEYNPWVPRYPEEAPPPRYGERYEDDRFIPRVRTPTKEEERRFRSRSPTRSVSVSHSRGKSRSPVSSIYSPTAMQFHSPPLFREGSRGRKRPLSPDAAGERRFIEGPNGHRGRSRSRSHVPSARSSGSPIPGLVRQWPEPAFTRAFENQTTSFSKESARAESRQKADLAVAIPQFKQAPSKDTNATAVIKREPDNAAPLRNAVIPPVRHELPMKPVLHMARQTSGQINPVRPERPSEESDMEMSLPPSPVRTSEFIASAKVGQSDQPLTSKHSKNGEAESSTVDESDMDMSPPASPSPRVVSISKPGTQVAPADKQSRDETREHISSVARTSGSSQIATAERVIDGHSDRADNQTRGNDSDMDMSPPASPPSHHSEEDVTHTMPVPRIPEPTSSRASPAPASPIVHPVDHPHGTESTEHSGAQSDGIALSPTLVTSPRTSTTLEDESRVPTTVHSPVSIRAPSEDTVPADGTTTAATTLVDVDPAEDPAQIPTLNDDAMQPHSGEGLSRAEPSSSAAEDRLVPTCETSYHRNNSQVVADLPNPGEFTAANPSGDPFRDALRYVVMTRLRCDRQTREERVNPVLLSNIAIADLTKRPSASPDKVIAETWRGSRLQARERAYTASKPSLQILFAERQTAISQKVQKLREEYMMLHGRWIAHCAKLDEVAKAAALEEAAATAGRTTRRTTAMGDAVRTDLEMEQIIASLGNEELTDANHLASKNAAVIPDMLSVTNVSVTFTFDDTNNEVDNPSEFYAPKTGIDDWTEEEKAVFLEKFGEFPKQFGIIADYLPHKTPAQCVTYYYLHKKKFIDFRQVVARRATGKRKRGGRRAVKKKGNALLTDIQQHDDEMSRDSTPTGPATRRRRNAAGTPVPSTSTELPPRRPISSRRSTAQLDNSPAATPTPEPEPVEPRRRRRTTKPSARATAALEQEQQETEEAEPESVEPEIKPAKRGRRSRKVKSSETVVSPETLETPLPFNNETRFIDQTDLSMRKKTPLGGVQWSEEDKELFLKLLAQHGADFKRIASSMPNKTTVQVSSYYKANLSAMDLERVAAGAPKRSPTPEPVPDSWQETTSTLPGSGFFMQPTRAGSSPPPANRQQEEPMAQESQRSRRSRDEAMRVQFIGVEPPPLTHSVPAMRASPFVSAPGPSSTSDRASSSKPHAAMTMMFPSSFAYSNLSPSHFVNDTRTTPRPTVRGLAPTATAPATTMTFDLAPWNGSSGRSTTPAMPTTLQTTDDLVAYLEHRTRLAEQRESDFM